MRLAVVDGQIAEREIDAQTNSLPSGARKLANLPVFASKEDAEEAIANRNKGPEGETIAEALEERGDVHKQHAENTLDILEYEYPSENPEENT